MLNTDKIKSASNVEVTVWLKLTESEARALKALTVYGSDEFLKFFYETLGKLYLEPHSKGLISLFETIRTELPKHLKRADDARAVFLKS